MTRIFALLALLCAFAAPARADDISAAARGVVRVVTIAVVNDEVVGFTHGSGFSVAPNLVVTNAHVVELAQRYPGNVIVGVVPSEGNRSYRGQVIALDQARDLALIRFTGINLPALTLYNGPLDEGSSVIALGYPGNVDLATARSAADFITPLTPVRSQGVFSGARSMTNVHVLLHTASIARGNSGGPLLDRCGRVLGVNSAVTQADEGDSSFGFAIAGSELSAFLAQAKQQYAAVGTACTSIEERMAQDRSADERARAVADEARRTADARAATDRQAAIAEASARNLTVRENYMGAAGLLLVLGALAIGSAGLMLTRAAKREAIWIAAGGAMLTAGAFALFFTRPGFDASKIVFLPSALPGDPTADGFGAMLCRIDPGRSRVTVSDTQATLLEVARDGCVNGRTQYAEHGKGWRRVLVPDDEQTVSVLDYDPATRSYANTRYLLGAQDMARLRALRGEMKLKACSTDQAARAALSGQQAAVLAALPQLYNEKLVYSCSPTAPTSALAPAAR